MLSCWHTKTGNESQLDVYIEATPPFGRRLARVVMAAHASLPLSKPCSQGACSVVFLMELFKTSKAKGSCVVTPDPGVLRLVSFLLLRQGQAQIFLLVLPLWQHLIFFRPLQQDFKLALFSSCHWWQLPVLHQVRNVLWRWGLCMVLMGLVTAVPHFIARKPSGEDGTLVVCPSETAFPMAMWRPSSRARSCCSVRSQVSSLGKSELLLLLS